MTALNAYATLHEFKAYWNSRGGTNSIDPFDDGVIESLLVSASRYIDGETSRHFDPYIETRYFSVPDGDSIDPRLLKLDDDLLEVISITNGDGVTIPSTEYTLQPRNTYPKRAIRLIGSSTYYWAVNSSGDSRDVIAVNGVWGVHDRYSQAWTVSTTAAEAMDATETGLTVAAGNSINIGKIARLDNELHYISAYVNNEYTITRGENYSTAATHLTGINLSIWQPMEEARNAVCEIANTAYRRRFGQTTSTTATVTAAGIVLSPRDIPAMAQAFISRFRNVL